jgi:two-component system, NarL family, nitrate/nitrite response regulator NarL
MAVLALQKALRHRRITSRERRRLRASLAGDPDGSTINVILVIEHRFYGEALARAVASNRVHVTALAEDADSAREKVSAKPPHVVVIDLPPLEGLAFTRWCVRTTPRTRVVALSLTETKGDVFVWAAAGLSGYVRPDASVKDVVRMIEHVARGEVEYPPNMVAAVLKHASALVAERATRLPRALTSRELEVLGLIEQGFSNREIAVELCIQLPTVKNHVHNILDKLNVERRGEAAACLRDRSGGHAHLLARGGFRSPPRSSSGSSPEIEGGSRSP